MASLEQNLTIFAGRDVQIWIPIYDINGNPYALPGATAAWAMAQFPSTPAVLSKSTALGGIVMELVNGVYNAVITIAHADTVALVTGITYYHELTVKDTSGNVVNVTEGQLTLNQSINPIF